MLYVTFLYERGSSVEEHPIYVLITLVVTDYREKQREC